MSKRSEIRVALEKFLRIGDGKAASHIVRDHRKRAVLVPDSLVDYDRIGKSGRAFLDFGVRMRIFREGPKAGEEVWVLPVELCQISRDEPAAAAGIVLPFGTIHHDGGLWLKYAPGYREVGVNDRGDVILVFDPSAAGDSVTGPVAGAVHTATGGRPGRLVARLDAEAFRADRQEAEAWLRVLASSGGPKSAHVDFKYAGLDCTHSGNVPHLNRAAKHTLYDRRDSEMLRIESLIRLRFRKARRQPPRVSVLSVAGVPRDQTAYGAFLKQLKGPKKDPLKLGLPAKLPESRFWDPASKKIVPTILTHLAPLSKLPDEVLVITVNTDHFGEVKGRGVVSPVASIMTLIDVISSRSSVAVLNKAGTATCFTGPTACGKSTAAMFWAERNEKLRRQELRRRYEVDLRRTPDAGRLGEAGIQKELDRTIAAVGILAHEDSVEILKEGAGRWMFWPTERALYARTAEMPGKRYILSENRPVLENVQADFGGSGDPRALGRITHECATERIFYDPEWRHFEYDRAPRMISAHVLMERGERPEFLVRRISAREAVDWLVQGRAPDGAHEPLCNPFLDFVGVLSEKGIVGPALPPAYEAAQRGDFGPIGGGDAKLGEAIYERLDALVKLWLDTFREVPTFLLSAGAGIELTQDAVWLLSEYPDLFGGWKQVPLEEFRKWMRERYGVTYGARGEWTHLPGAVRAG